LNNLNGKVAVVLGASAEAGTGWAIAEELAAAGAKVVVGARSEAPLKKLAGKIGGHAVVCDAGNEAQVKNLIDATIKQYGRLDIAVNSAGASTLALIADMTDELLQPALQLNFYAHVYFVKHAAAAMKDGGSIILVSSLSTTHPVFPNFAYAAAKSATDCLVRYAALEYGPRNIRVNSILPGPIVSDMTKGFLDNPEIAKVFLKEIPMGRLGYPKDFANAVVWLAGPAYVTGLNIPICGGNQLTRFPFMNEFPGAGNAWEGQGTTLHDRENPKA
jgi:NAD(P)-dependent dehydrogenase (short-subunit alcohol dehydrogenase family)